MEFKEFLNEYISDEIDIKIINNMFKNLSTLESAIDSEEISDYVMNSNLDIDVSSRIKNILESLNTGDFFIKCEDLRIEKDELFNDETIYPPKFFELKYDFKVEELKNQENLNIKNVNFYLHGKLKKPRKTYESFILKKGGIINRKFEKDTEVIISDDKKFVLPSDEVVIYTSEEFENYFLS